MIGTREMITPGNWFALCCQLDLGQLITTDDVEEALQLWDEGLAVGVWWSYGEAMADLHRRDHQPTPSKPKETPS